MSGEMEKSIEVSIAGKRIPLRVTAEEEPQVRKIEKDLQQKIQEFQLQYKDKDKMDCVVMTLLSIAIEKEDGNLSGDQKTELHTQLQKLDALLSEAV